MLFHSLSFFNCSKMSYDFVILFGLAILFYSMLFYSILILFGIMTVLLYLLLNNICNQPSQFIFSPFLFYYNFFLKKIIINFIIISFLKEQLHQGPTWHRLSRSVGRKQICHWKTNNVTSKPTVPTRKGILSSRCSVRDR